MLLYRFNEAPLRIEHLTKVEPEGSLIRVHYLEGGKERSALGYFLREE